MPKLTPEKLAARRELAEKQKANAAKHIERLAEAKRIVQTGKCPQCGSALRRNLSMAGWYQCEQLGAEGFRKDASKPSCSFQTFTE